MLLVAILLWVPAGVRATQRVNGSGSFALRLNRGFDMPVDRQSVPPADLASTIPHTLSDESESIVVLQPPAYGDDSVPASPETLPPDPLRGPPLSSIN
jgi:hypothetical protein